MIYGLGASRVVTLARVTFNALSGWIVRRRYHQILRPRRHLAKLANHLRRHADPSIRFHLHRIWQTAERYLEVGNASWLISHLGFLPLPFAQQNYITSQVISKS
jgi:hypothetical protein